MNEGKKGKRHQLRGDDDWRARFDGIEHAGDQQVDALRRLALESKTAASGAVRDGRVTALQGHFPTETPDPMKAVAAFLATHAVALGFDAPGRDDTFAAPRFVDCDEARPRDVDTILFSHRVQGVPTYRAGVSVEVDRGGSVRLLQALIPTPLLTAKGSRASGARKVATSARVPKGRGAARARKVVAALLGDDESARAHIRAVRSCARTRRERGSPSACGCSTFVAMRRFTSSFRTGAGRYCASSPIRVVRSVRCRRITSIA